MRPADGTARAPARLDPRSDAPQLGLRRERRLLGSRELCRGAGGDRRRPALPRLPLAPLALGDIAYVERPLYDYVQHGQATLGHDEATRVAALRNRFGSLRSDPRERVRAWKQRYFFDACRLMQSLTVLRMRCGARMT